jgi:CRP/FNR family cyclic AMP-dependent transcriptional regulator
LVKFLTDMPFRRPPDQLATAFSKAIAYNAHLIGGTVMAAAALSAEARLARIPFLQGANLVVLKEAVPLARWMTLRSGEQAVGFGDTTNDVFLIEEGAVRVIIQTRLGHEVIFGDLGAGEVFGEIAAIDSAPRSASVTALQLTHLCKLPAEVFLQLALHSPDVGRRLVRKLVERLRLQDERNLELVSLPVRLRLVAELLRLSRPRAMAEGGSAGAVRVVSPPPHHHILAARIGTRREAISRELTVLANEGLLLATPRGIVLPQPTALKALIDTYIGGPEFQSLRRIP